MKKLMMIAFAATLATTTACSKKTPSCEDLFEHTKSIAPPEMREMIEKGKDKAIEKCGKMSNEAKQCAADAKSMQDLQNCPRS